MSLWQFAAQIGGVIAANSTDGGGLTREDADDMAEFLKSHR